MIDGCRSGSRLVLDADCGLGSTRPNQRHHSLTPDNTEVEARVRSLASPPRLKYAWARYRVIDRSPIAVRIGRMRRWGNVAGQEVKRGATSSTWLSPN
jgi:hypothetical protein